MSATKSGWTMVAVVAMVTTCAAMTARGVSENARERPLARRDPLTLERGWNASQIRVVVLVQEQQSRRIVAAGSAPLQREQ